ncbi:MULTISPECIES: hypothetical protein [Acinetobacter]|jgi:hypothetical protein|uniref:Uncharacterized protein n=3 Tax=Acinetobacter baumannii TaxID=470 RepID=A0A1L9XCA2_ACIBA|nr:MULTISPECIES: hypothetical protein [Acinetobacter]EXB45074.1 hypothetical protein J540_3016 [Acinetobacter baumannii 1440422]KCY49135.1 hypothetical protein J715_2102 [Acinetobacter baumannii 1571545]ATI40477.1 hypothetical protein BS103_18115 [Acinetobacter baumannii]AUT40121.1 hypothetical protein C2U32_19375 [Acinetobacter baumannii]AVI35330.1 hypothetical protein CSB70_4132 [Acinetobacter baumannii]
MSGRGGLSLGKAAKVQAENSNASDFTKSAPVQTATATPEANEKPVDFDKLDELSGLSKPKEKKDREAPWRQGINIAPEDLKLIQRPFNNNISQEMYLRLNWLKSISSIGMGSNKTTFTTMLNEALEEYTARRIKKLGDNYDV